MKTALFGGEFFESFGSIYFLASQCHLLLAPFFWNCSNDFRSTLPRFMPEAMKANQDLVDLLGSIAAQSRPSPRRSLSREAQDHWQKGLPYSIRCRKLVPHPRTPAIKSSTAVLSPRLLFKSSPLRSFHAGRAIQIDGLIGKCRREGRAAATAARQRLEFLEQ